MPLKFINLDYYYEGKTISMNEYLKTTLHIYKKRINFLNEQFLIIKDQKMRNAITKQIEYIHSIIDKFKN